MFNIVMPYYMNHTMAAIQVAFWDSYPREIKKELNIIIVDDGSPEYPATEAFGAVDLPIFIYRIKKDIPWNQHGARNLGMKMADGWCLLTDMDMVLPLDSLLKLNDTDLDKNNYYTLGRLKMPDKSFKKYHCNSHLIHTDLYWKVNGYNTNYCGSYGGDGPFVRSLNKISTRVFIEHIPLYWYGRSYIKDSGTNNYDRTGYYKDEYNKKIKNPSLSSYWNPINFEWERRERIPQEENKND